LVKYLVLITSIRALYLDKTYKYFCSMSSW